MFFSRSNTFIQDLRFALFVQTFFTSSAHKFRQALQIQFFGKRFLPCLKHTVGNVLVIFQGSFQVTIQSAFVSRRPFSNHLHMFLVPPRLRNRIFMNKGKNLHSGSREKTKGDRRRMHRERRRTERGDGEDGPTSTENTARVIH